jgi:hypothetical protein
MFRGQLITTGLRNASWAAAFGGILASIAMYTCGPLGRFDWFHLSFVPFDVIPYAIVGVATTLAQTRFLALVCVVASLSILTVGLYTYVDLIRVRGINDIQLATDPLRWLFGVLALLLTGVGLIARKIQKMQTTPLTRG